MRYAVFEVKQRDGRLRAVGLAFCLPDAAAMAMRLYASGTGVSVRFVTEQEAQALAARKIAWPWVTQEKLPGEAVAWREFWQEPEEVRS